MDTKKASPNADPIGIAESLGLKLDLLDLALTGLSVKCEASTPDYQEDIRPILELLWDAKDKSRELGDYVRRAIPKHRLSSPKSGKARVSEAHARLKPVPTQAA